MSNWLSSLSYCTFWRSFRLTLYERSASLTDCGALGAKSLYCHHPRHLHHHTITHVKYATCNTYCVVSMWESHQFNKHLHLTLKCLNVPSTVILLYWASVRQPVAIFSGEGFGNHGSNGYAASHNNTTGASIPSEHCEKGGHLAPHASCPRNSLCPLQFKE